VSKSDGGAKEAINNIRKIKNNIDRYIVLNLFNIHLNFNLIKIILKGSKRVKNNIDTVEFIIKKLNKR
tara:strand:- start:3650 stop:3853 length:204 start_codon:yes stop_codon:yes gene_type:complete